MTVRVLPRKFNAMFYERPRHLRDAHLWHLFTSVHAEPAEADTVFGRVARLAGRGELDAATIAAVLDRRWPWTRPVVPPPLGRGRPGRRPRALRPAAPAGVLAARRTDRLRGPQGAEFGSTRLPVARSPRERGRGGEHSRGSARRRSSRTRLMCSSRHPHRRGRSATCGRQRLLQVAHSLRERGGGGEHSRRQAPTAVVAYPGSCARLGIHIVEDDEPPEPAAPRGGSLTA